MDPIQIVLYIHHSAASVTKWMKSIRIFDSTIEAAVPHRAPQLSETTQSFGARIQQETADPSGDTNA